LQSDWRNLCLYLRDCVQYEVSGRALRKSQAAYVLLRGTETLLTQGSVSISADLPFRPAGRGQTLSVQYGWPLLIFQALNRSAIVAPLFTVVCEMSMPNGADPAKLTPITDPDLNVALFSPELLPPELQSEIEDLIGEDPDFKSPGFTSKTLPKLAALLDVPYGDFDGTLQTKIPKDKGLHHVATVTQIDESDATRDLLAELRDLSARTDWRDTSAATLLGLDPAPPAAKKGQYEVVPVAPLPLNESQEEALARIRQSPVTAVTGPPGTGKSQIVVSAIANSWVAEEKVLLASTNNAAVDVAIHRADSLALGLLVRTGNKALREQLPTTITNILRQASTRTDPQIRNIAAASLSSRFTFRQTFLNSLSELEQAEANLLDLLGRVHESALRIWNTPSLHQSNFANANLANAAHRIVRLPLFRIFRLKRLFRRFDASPPSIELDHVRAWSRLCREFETSSARVNALRDSALPNLSDTLSSLDTDYVTASVDFLRIVVNDSVAANKAAAGGAGAAGIGGRKNQDAIRYAQSALKGWACTALSMKRNFDLRANSFDLAVIDEASQCSLAYILPIAYRARRIAVVGDPNQLPPVITLGSKIADSLARKNGVTGLLQRNPGIEFVDGSAFHAFEAVHGHGQTRLLNEHFRCHPRIARWFNSVFYGDSLHVLTDVSAMTSHERGLAWVDVSGKAERPTFGRSWVNHTEAEAAVELVREMAAKGLSVGVVSPFAAQAGLIEKLVEGSVDSETLNSANFVVGTAHRLQGDERDAVIFSCCVTPGTLKSTVRWIEDTRNLVNVAVSRARQRLVILGHPAIDAIESPTLSSLRAFAFENREDQMVPRRVDSHAEAMLLESMLKYGLNPVAKIEVEGFELDFAVFVGSRRINIEVDGDHHLDHNGSLRRRDVARDRVLNAAGWEVLRFPAWRCWSEPTSVAAEVHTYATSAKP